MTDDKMPPLPLIPGAVLGLYGEDGVCLVRRGSEDSQIARKGGQRLVTEQAARAYAAEQVRELVEALEECVEDSQAAVDNYVMNYGENWRPSRLAGLRAQVAKVRALIAKHKGTT